MSIFFYKKTNISFEKYKMSGLTKASGVGTGASNDDQIQFNFHYILTIENKKELVPIILDAMCTPDMGVNL
jgi:hypothetical protein